MPRPEEVQILVVKQVPLLDLRALYQETGWIKSDENVSDTLLEKIVSGSFCFVGVFSNQQLIGMGRALSDGVSDAWIQDVAVLKKYRGQGIGKKIINRLVTHLKDCGIGWIGLVGEPGTQKFYEDLGFSELKKYIPMRYNTN